MSTDMHTVFYGELMFSPKDSPDVHAVSVFSLEDSPDAHAVPVFSLEDAYEEEFFLPKSIYQRNELIEELRSEDCLILNLLSGNSRSDLFRSDLIETESDLLCFLIKMNQNLCFENNNLRESGHECWFCSQVSYFEKPRWLFTQDYFLEGMDIDVDCVDNSIQLMLDRNQALTFENQSLKATFYQCHYCFQYSCNSLANP